MKMNVSGRLRHEPRRAKIRAPRGPIPGRALVIFLENAI